MPTDTDLNISPYFNDFDPENDFHMVLHKAGVALQARELTSAQSIILDKLEKLGRFSLDEGSVLEGCNFSYDQNVRFVRILDTEVLNRETTTRGVGVNIALFSPGMIMVGESSGSVAEIVDSADGFETDDIDTKTLFYKFVGKRPSFGTDVPEFQDGEDILVVPKSATLEDSVFIAYSAGSNATARANATTGAGYAGVERIVYEDVTISSVDKTAGVVDGLSSVAVTSGKIDVLDLLLTPPVSYNAATGGDIIDVTEPARINFDFDEATRITAINDANKDTTGLSYQFAVENGLIWQKGTPLRVESQSVIVDKYDNRPNDKAVVFEVKEEIVTSNSDQRLFDNAKGFNNENAPGADRLKLTPKLAVINDLTTSTLSENHVKLVEFRDGKPVRINQVARLGRLGDVIARRSDETQGDYVVNPFYVISQADESNGDEYGELYLSISGGLAYIKGYRQEFHASTKVVMDRGDNNVQSAAEQSISVNFENYVEVSDVKGHPMANDDVEVWFLRGTPTDAPSIGSSTGLTITNNVPSVAGTNVLGKSWARGFQHEDGDRFRCYFMGGRDGEYLDYPPLSTESVIAFDSSNNYSFSASLEDEGQAGNKVPIYRLGHKAIKSLSGVTYKGQAKKTLSTINVSATEIVNGVTFDTLSDDPWDGDTGTVVLVADDVVLYTEKNGVDIDGTGIENKGGLTIAFPSSTFSSSATRVVLYYNSEIEISTSSLREKTPTKLTTSEDITLVAGQSTYDLANIDIYELAVVESGSADITKDFVLDGGQRDTYYDYGKITNNGSTTTGTISVMYKYFSHNLATGSSPLFFKNSYGTDSTDVDFVPIEDIPRYESTVGTLYDLRDSVDCRPVIGSSGFGSTSGTTNHVVPNSFISFNAEYYLGRVDILEVNKRGDFNIVKGEPSIDPVPPFPSSDAMAITSIDVQPYPALDTVTAQNAGRVDLGVRLNDKQRQRLTQANLGSMQERVKALEYYTALTLLEKNTNDLVIRSEVDSTLNRFKLGILVDNFETLSVGDIRDPEFKVSVDPARKLMQPLFRAYNIDLVPHNVTDSSDIKHGDILTLPPATTDEEMVISQSQATTSRVCAGSVYNYRGEVKLTPNYDNGPDVTNGPVKAINLDIDTAGPALAVLDQVNNILVDQFTEEEVVTTTDQQVSREIETTGNAVTRKVHTDITTTTTTTQRVDQLRGTKETNTSRQRVGDFVTDVSFRRWIRAQQISFVANGLMPNVRHWIFFDGEDVTDFCRKTVGSGFDGNMISTDSGELQGVFNLPAKRFFVGDRNFVIVSEPTLDNRLEALSASAGRFSAYNFSANRSGLDVNLNTRSLDIDSEEVINTETMRTYRRLTSVSTTTLNLSLTPRRSSMIVANWNRIPEASGYILKYSAANSDALTNTVNLSSSSTTYTIRGLTAGASYKVQVVASVA